MSEFFVELYENRGCVDSYQTCDMGNCFTCDADTSCFTCDADTTCYSYDECYKINIDTWCDSCYTCDCYSCDAGCY